MPHEAIDDFVLTISDNEELTDSEVESDLSEAHTPSANKKRRRDPPTEAPNSKKRKINKSQLQDDAEQDRSEEQLPSVQDAAFDPDFVFDLGAKVLADVVEGFDGWGSGSKEPQGGNKKALDIDDIISRRAAKKSKHITSTKSHENVDDESHLSGSDGAHHEDHETQSRFDENGSEGEDDDGEDEEEAEERPQNPYLDDDPLLAEDTFGGQANPEDEDDLDTAASDDDSVATPTAHPEDSEADSGDETSSQTSHSSVNSVEAAKRAAFFAEEQTAGSDAKKSGMSSFLQFSLSRPLLRALTALSFTQPTPIQARTIPLALQGLDIVGSAQTGSGKTAAFLLPIFERLLYRPSKVPVTRVAILMPTRELAVQCYNVATALARYTDITFAQVVGGFSLREQENTLKKRPDVVIATPGRFIDHMRNSASFQVESIEILVLDEADRMLEDGFADELDEILKTIPRGRQTMLFSATMTNSVDKLVRVGMDKPVRVSVDDKKSTVEGLTQEFVRLRPGREEMRLATLCLLCQNFFTKRTIVFFRQKKEAHRVRVVFGLLGIKAGELHGSMSQEQRITAVNAFRDGKTTHLLATDLASRGLDIKNVMSVINYEAPQSHEIYLHRVGRTARAGRSGSACTIAAEPDRKVVKAAVKAARSQGAKIMSRTMETKEVDSMNQQLDSFTEEIEEILKEEKEEKALAQTETQIRRGENLVKHEAEIMARPKRTWFESEKERQAAKDKGHQELNGLNFVGEKKKLSNKQKKQLDSRRERLEGRTIKKRKDSEMKVKAARAENKRNKKDKAKGKGKK